MKKYVTKFKISEYLFFLIITILIFLLCVCVGSVNIPLKDTVISVYAHIFGLPAPEEIANSIIISVRIPRTISVALVGASLSLCGAAMQGLLKNPLADGSTLGVSAGASLGAVTAIAFGTSIPFFGNYAIMLTAMLFAFISLILILFLAHKLDHSLSSNTIILIGVIFNMFTHSLISLIVTFADDKVKSIMFWTMGSLAGSSYKDVGYLLAALILFGGIIFRYSRELNAFAVGEDNAAHVGVDVKRTKLVVLVCVSAVIGVCVSIAGTIGFVGLVIPHMIRMIVGPNHKRLLPASMFVGASFLMLTDLFSRILLNPIELPIGVVTSFIGSFVFIYIFYSSGKVK